MQITITDLNTQGQGVGRLPEGKAVFVPDAVIGDVVDIDVFLDKKEYAVGRITKIEKPSPDRATPACRHFGICGGCQIQHLSYPAQLAFKQKTVQQALQRIGGFTDIKINPIVPADPIQHYRNKSQIPIGYDRDILTGFYKVNSHSIVNMNECWVHPTDYTKIALAFRQFLKEQKIHVYDERTHKGLVRHLIIRSSDYLKETLVGIVINAKEFGGSERLIAFAEELNEKLNYKIASIVINTNQEKTNRIMGEKTEPIYGSGFITEKIGKYFFKVSLDTFLQIHHNQAEKAYALIHERLQPGMKLLIDAYCGIGAITLNVADKAEKVIGIEENKQAIKDAKRNALNNDIHNTEFFCGSVERYDFAQHGQLDAVIVDPPRKGLEKSVTDVLRLTAPQQILYMSCDAATLARDLKLLTADNTYKIIDVTPFDFFPQTTHVECVVELQRL
jgi:23S rRNA (uracil1939-C5)-methyltransferase